MLTESLVGLQIDNLQQPNIRNVWVYNFEEELENISNLIDDYPFIAMVS